MEGIAFIPIVESSQPAEARRIAVRMADEIGFTESARGNLSIVVTEAATNLLKHAGGGQIILRCSDSTGLEILALDKGPGMRSVAECSRDGYSTAGSSGTGLGAISRLSSSDIYSVEGEGTIVRAFCPSGQTAEAEASDWDWASIVSPLASETMCGDGMAIRETASSLQILAADGLGHGPLAAEAADAAKKIFRSTQGTPVQLAEAIHRGLRPTRGAAIAVAEIDRSAGRVRYCGIGNIAGVLVEPAKSQHMVSMSGIAGHQAARIRDFEYPWNPGAVIVMHSDGLSSRWQLSSYPGLPGRQASMIAAALFRDFRKANDDASVIVGKQK